MRNLQEIREYDSYKNASNFIKVIRGSFPETYTVIKETVATLTMLVIENAGSDLNESRHKEHFKNLFTSSKQSNLSTFWRIIQSDEISEFLSEKFWSIWKIWWIDIASIFENELSEFGLMLEKAKEMDSSYAIQDEASKLHNMAISVSSLSWRSVAECIKFILWWWEIKVDAVSDSTEKKRRKYERLDSWKTKRDEFKKYLDTFFSWDIKTPKESAISYKDMHTCFEKDTWISINYSDVSRIWQAVLEDKNNIKLQEDGDSSEMTTPKNVSKDTHDNLTRKVMHADKSWVILTPNEVADRKRI